jgi:hypothetical protein
MSGAHHFDLRHGSGDIRIGPDLSRCTTQRDDVELRFARSDGSDDFVV